MNPTLAVIGASIGQRPVYQKARELGFRTIGFAWEKGAVCRDLADRFYPISITETDAIVDVCRKEGVSGVVSNGSDFTAEATSRISSALGLPGVPYESFLRMKDKFAVRELTCHMDGLYSPWYYRYGGQTPPSFPCIVKPCVGAAKMGVSYVDDLPGFQTAIRYAREQAPGSILVEAYVPGREISVESLSYRGTHEIVQITDKETSGPPHFVETAHHQPSTLSPAIKERVKDLVQRILTLLYFDNGASHTELKITEDGSIFLVEVNPRGGGDEIASRLVSLSTGFDYVAACIRVALGQYAPTEIKNIAYSGIYYLCSQTKHLRPLFDKANGKPWLVEKIVLSDELHEATSNYDRDGSLIYVADHRILPTE